jgi:mono/diheme cytochrome c family protein
MSPHSVPILIALAITVHSGQGAAANFGRQNYVQYCAGCHRLDGLGSPENGVPRIKDAAGHFLRLSEGRAYLVQVPGVSQAILSDRQVAELLNWMLKTMTSAELPADWVPYTEAEVRVLRAAKPDDVLGMRRAIVEKLHTMGYAMQ